MIDKNQIKFNNLVSKINSEAEVKECFAKDDTCNHIIPAHRIQKKGPLKLLEEKVKGNNKVVHLGSFKKSIKRKSFTELKPIGKQVATTFKGFCGKHDRSIFSDIDNNQFDLENDKHCFLFTYKTLAGEFHNYKEGINKIYHPILSQLRQGDSPLQKLQIEELLLKYEMLQSLKSILNKNLKSENHSDLFYDGLELEDFYPITSSYLFWHPYDKSGIMELPSFFFMNLVPEESKTCILFSTLKNDVTSTNYIEKILELKEDKQNTKISQLLINSSTVMSPSLWKKLTNIEKKKIKFDLSRKGGIEKSRKEIKRMNKVKVNFFK